MVSTPSKQGPQGHNEAVGNTLLTTKEAAQYLGLASTTLDKWRLVGKGPSFMRFGRTVRYRQSDLDAYMAANTTLSSQR